MTTTSLSGWRRVDRGKGHSYYDPNGELVEGVTTLIRDGVPKPAFVETAAKAVAEWSGDNKDRLAELSPSAVVNEALSYWRANRYGPRDRGKTVHDLAEHLLRDEEVEYDPSEEGVVRSFLRFAEEWNVDPVALEAVVVSTRWRYCGTLDFLGYVGDPRRLALLDWKTGRSGVWPEAALQLAAYRHADFYVDADGLEVPMPDVELVAAVYLQDDSYAVHPVDASEQTFRVFLHAAQVARFAKRDRFEIVHDAVRGPQ